MKKRVSLCVGTRPEAIKMAPVIRAFQKDGDFEVSVCATGQHIDMAQQVFDLFGITPDINFEIMNRASGLSNVLGKLIINFDNYLDEFSPDLVIAQGDTSTVFAAAISAYHKKIRFGHVEAGLRTGNIYSPWPEEGYRVMASTIANHHFAPTIQNKENLLRMGVQEQSIVVTGNTVIDALLYMCKEIDEGRVSVNLPQEILDIPSGKLVLITGHRRENFGAGISNLCDGISELTELYKDLTFVYPVHLNPVVRSQVEEVLGYKKRSNIILLDPVSYAEFIWLMRRSFLIITDSGGIQEEAPSLGKPVLVTRDTTERPEGVVAGAVKLLGTSKEALVDSFIELVENKKHYEKMSNITSPFGDGAAAEKILESCNKFLV